MQIKNHRSLKTLTTFKVGGKAQYYLKLNKSADFKQIYPKLNHNIPWQAIGGGSNILISDKGLPGLTLHFNGGQVKYNLKQSLLTADAGVAWDDLVKHSLKHRLWGLELLSGIPGTVGGAVALNINAYGQMLSTHLKSVLIYDKTLKQFKHIQMNPKQWGYKVSPFANKPHQLILSASFQLPQTQDTILEYRKALDFAKAHHLKINDLKQRRQIILGVRQAAGSLLETPSKGVAKTGGSFFKNPLVNHRQLKYFLKFEESNTAIKDLLKMNAVHGGNKCRVSAAHILLAAGFSRGQKFQGGVQLHRDHVLKIENHRLSNAQNIYKTARHIQDIVKQKFRINLEFEVVTLGEFTN